MDSNCPICLETAADTKVDCCNNNFHKTCLTEWKKIKNTCPLCRKEFPLHNNNDNKRNTIFFICFFFILLMIFLTIGIINFYLSKYSVQTTCEILSKEINEKLNDGDCCNSYCSGCTWQNDVCIPSNCHTICSNLYTPTVIGRYENEDEYVYYSENEQYCSEFPDQANDYLSEFPDIGNSTCYYLPKFSHFKPVYSPIMFLYPIWFVIIFLFGLLIVLIFIFNNVSKTQNNEIV